MMGKTMRELAADVSEEEKAQLAEAVKPGLARSMFSRPIPMSEFLGEAESRRFCRGWQFWPSSNALATIHLSPDDHVTVTCHCPRCEAERAQAAELSPLVLNEPVDFVADARTTHER